jgi:hypothetical protein
LQALDSSGEINIGDSDEEGGENKDVEFLLSTIPIPDYLILAATEQRMTPQKRAGPEKESKNAKQRKTK